MDDSLDGDRTGEYMRVGLLGSLDMGFGAVV